MANDIVQISGVPLRAYDDGGAYSLAVATPAYATVVSGQVISGTVALQLPSVPCKLAWLRGYSSNSGYTYVGGSGVTSSGTAAATTVGMELSAGDVFGPVPVANLNQIYHVSSADSQRLIYFAVR